MLRERDWKLERSGWDKAQSQHRSASRSEGAFKQLLSAEQLSGLPPTRSTFYESDGGCRAATRVVRLFKAAGGGTKDSLVLEASPFCPESGGQIGDAGKVRTADG